MSISIKVRAKFTITCDFIYGGYMQAHKHASYKNHECSEPVEVEGFVYVKQQIDVNSVPSKHDVIEELDYEFPEGWGIWYNTYDRDNVICTECKTRLDKLK